jgi:hypothetical protein
LESYLVHRQHLVAILITGSTTLQSLEVESSSLSGQTCMFTFLNFLWCVILLLWLFVLLSSPWAKTLDNGIMWSLMLFMWCDMCCYASIFHLLFRYMFIFRTDQLRFEHWFIIMRHIMINGINELIWLSRGWTHTSYLKT